MKLNRKLVLILSLVLSLALATGGTLAYLSDTDADVNTMTLGNVYIVQNEQERDADGKLEAYENDEALYPAVYEGDEIADEDEDAWPVPGNEAWKVVADNELVVDKFVTVTNTGKSDAYVRTLIAYEGDETYGPDGKYIHIVHNAENVAPAIAMDKVGLVEIDDVTYTVYSYTYAAPVKPGETTIPSLKQVYMDKEADNEVVATYGEEYKIIALSQAVQTAGFESAENALNTAFGEANETNLAKWFGEAEADIGSPSDKPLPDGNIDNNPPVKYTGDPAELAKLLTEATDAGSGDVTIDLTESYDMTGIDWTPINVDGYHGADVVTVEGNGNIIKGLNAPLFAGGFAGESGIIIKDLTIADSVMTAPTDQGSGAFICCVDSMETIVLENCHAKNVTLNGKSRTGGLIGWTSGYSNQNDGPVKTYVTLTNCTVEGCTINAETESAGGLIGHSGASDWTYTTVTGCKVIDTKINGGSDRTGIYVGTANVGETTFTGCSYEDVTGTLNENHVLYGRFVPGSTGKLTIDGVEIK